MKRAKKGEKSPWTTKKIKSEDLLNKMTKAEFLEGKTLHTAGAPGIRIDQSGFSRREKTLLS